LSYPQITSSPRARVFAMTTHRGDLYVGGFFSIAGGYPAYGLARWVATPKLRLDSISLASNPAQLRFRGLAGLRYQLQATDSFSSWTNVHSGRGVDESEEVFDTPAMFRFYRALLTE
jgi:hypothetical protein